MAKSKTKDKSSSRPKKRKKAPRDPEKITECVSCLVELHKLQGVLLTQLSKEI